MIGCRFMAYGVGAISTPLGGLVGGGLCGRVVLGTTYFCREKAGNGMTPGCGFSGRPIPNAGKETGAPWKRSGIGPLNGGTGSRGMVWCVAAS